MGHPHGDYDSHWIHDPLPNTPFFALHPNLHIEQCHIPAGTRNNYSMLPHPFNPSFRTPNMYHVFFGCHWPLFVIRCVFPPVMIIQRVPTIHFGRGLPELFIRKHDRSSDTRITITSIVWVMGIHFGLSIPLKPFRINGWYSFFRNSPRFGDFLSFGLNFGFGLPIKFFASDFLLRTDTWIGRRIWIRW